MNDDNSLNSAFSNGYDDGLEDGHKQGVADERARCLRRLDDLQWELSEREAATVGKAIGALSEASTPVPVASSPVGGEQHG